jgi:hypothetical protein
VLERVLAIGPPPDDDASPVRAIRGRLADGLVALRDFLGRSDPTLAPISHTRALAIVGAIIEVLKHTFYTSGIDALPAL